MEDDEVSLQPFFLKSLDFWEKKAESYIKIIKSRVKDELEYALNAGKISFFFPNGLSSRLQCLLRKAHHQPLVEQFISHIRFSNIQNLAPEIVEVLEGSIWHPKDGSLAFYASRTSKTATIIDKENYLKNFVLPAVKTLIENSEKEEVLLNEQNLKCFFSSEIFQHLVLHKVRKFCGNICSVSTSKPPFGKSIEGNTSALSYIAQETPLDFIFFDFTEGIPKR
jgi:hypothetical protein